MKYIVYAIPVFLLLIAVEVTAVRILGRDHYSLPDSVSDLGTGLLQQLLEALLKVALFAGYAWLYATHRLAELPMTSVAAWVACFLGVDFLYYWFHRTSHEVNAFWAAHVVHHQSEEFNLAVALRQGALQGGFSWAFYLPLALLGFPPAMFLTCASVNTLYQFWIHTRLIGRLGPLEWVFNTPSHHRVHHARNPKYIDRNHAGTLIVWDRLFGTFVREEEEPVYGITAPLRSWNPVWANAHYWVFLARKARDIPRAADRLRLLFARPGWLPEALGGYVPPPEVDAASARKYRPEIPRAVLAYVTTHFALALAAGSALLLVWDALPAVTRAAGAVSVVLALLTSGGLLDRRGWAMPVEALRLAAVVPAAAMVAGLPAAALAAAAAVASGLWLSRTGAPSAATPRTPVRAA